MADRVSRAGTHWSRMVGLLGRESLGDGEGLWIEPCAMIHTFFMRFAIDAVFLDREGKAVRVVEDLRPWRVSPWVLGASSVLELAGGSLKGAVKPGDALEIA